LPVPVSGTVPARLDTDIVLMSRLETSAPRFSQTGSLVGPERHPTLRQAVNAIGNQTLIALVKCNTKILGNGDRLTWSDPNA
jgi:hypothetical protein